MKTSVRSITSIVIITVAFLYIGLLPKAGAVNPPPDGGYPLLNTAEGQNALASLTTGAANTAIGYSSLSAVKTGSFNTAVGAGSLFANLGNQNTATGAGALLNNSTGSFNTANGEAALFFNTTGTSNTAVGSSALLHNTIAIGSTAIGDNALMNNTTGGNNTATGSNALINNTMGDNNTATGSNALQSNTEGARNTAMGVGALLNSTGNDNIAVGAGAGTFPTAGGNNIYVGNKGVATEDNTIRIGDDKIHTTAFIAGITGVDQGSPTAVFINTTTGQLGTTPPASSRRFKTDIKPMAQTSEAILALKPVTFQYKSDTNGRPQFGLIAEEVAEVNPDLVVRDKKGEVYTVRYDTINAMLLNEFLKEHRKVEQLTQDFELKFAQQQKQIEALSADLQKVNAQLEASKPTKQLVANGH